MSFPSPHRPGNSSTTALRKRHRVTRKRGRHGLQGSMAADLSCMRQYYTTHSLPPTLWSAPFPCRANRGFAALYNHSPQQLLQCWKVAGSAVHQELRNRGVTVPSSSDLPSICGLIVRETARGGQKERSREIQGLLAHPPRRLPPALDSLCVLAK